MVNTRQSGYIALLSVLIMGAATLAIGLALLASGTDNQRMVLVEQQSTKARGMANACAEEALQVIHGDTAYVGTANLSIATDDCQYIVSSTGASTRVIDTNSTVGNITRKLKVHVTINATSISITSWKEVVDA